MHSADTRFAGAPAWTALSGCIVRRAAALDAFEAYPTDDIADLHDSGLLMAPFPRELGGLGWCGDGQGPDELFDALATIGAANLSLGRLYEGHVNAVKLVCAYGTLSQVKAFARDVQDGHMSGVWNADGDAGAVATAAGPGDLELSGGKIWASGAGYLSRAIVTARIGSDTIMILMPASESERTDRSLWRPSGMRATATGAIDLSGMTISMDRVIGRPGDYLRHPLFAGGAWRFLAVQAGAVRGLAEAAADDLRRRMRTGDPMQQARFGAVSIAADTAIMWAQRASRAAESGLLPEDALKVEIAKARLAIERAALDIMEAVTRGIGLTGLIAPSPIDRMLRDLATYLRQPGPDQALLSVGNAFMSRHAMDEPIGLPEKIEELGPAHFNPDATIS